MAYKVIFSPTAELRLTEIKTYIAYELLAPYSAKRIMAIIRKTVKLLEAMPEIGVLSENPCLKNENTHIIHADKYRIYYSINKKSKTIHIHTILHHLQNEKFML